jgi:hypothetical protein
MTRRVRKWITATVAIAATGLMVGLAITATPGVNESHTRMSAADSKGDIAYQHNIATRDRIVWSARESGGSPCTLHDSYIPVRQTWPWLNWSRGCSKPIRTFEISGPDSARVTS